MTQSKFNATVLGVLTVALLSSVLVGPVQAGTRPQDQHNRSADVVDLDDLTSKILKTQGIGMFAKLDLQSRFTALLDDINLFHQGRSTQTPSQLRGRFNLIILKVIALLREGDPALHNELVGSREVIWHAINDQNSVH